MRYHGWPEPPPTGVRLLVLRIGTVASLIGWLLLAAVIVGAPLVALIYHALT